MNKDKQIEEMALDIHAEGSFGLELSATLAEGLTEKGYRKASDVARELIDELENSIDGLLKVYIEERAKECAIDTPLAEYLSGKIDAYSSIKFRLAELKKKYTEEVK